MLVLRKKVVSPKFWIIISINISNISNIIFQTFYTFSIFFFLPRDLKYFAKRIVLIYIVYTLLISTIKVETSFLIEIILYSTSSTHTVRILSARTKNIFFIQRIMWTRAKFSRNIPATVHRRLNQRWSSYFRITNSEEERRK